MEAILDTLITAAYEWNLCKCMFSFYIVCITLGGILVNLPVLPLPDVFLQAFKFGKMAHTSGTSNFIALFECPKRWFCHFYVVATIVVGAALVLMWQLYVRGEALLPLEKTLLDVITTPTRTPVVNTTSAALGLLLFALQIFRRLYENLFVSVFSSSKINILHYIVGHTHYLGAIALLLAELPGFDGKEFQTSVEIAIHHLVGILVCLFGYFIQFASLCTLADLRKNRGKALKEKHMMPRGGMFEMVSCPHMLAEVLVYVGIMIVLWSHTGWLLVTAWAIANQVQVAVMNHQWYRDTFKDYPLQRKAIFPFLL